jgi:hypothetical protein
MTNEQTSNNEWLKSAMYKLYVEWCRLKNYPLPKNNFEQWMDEESGIQDERMTEFIKWFNDEILTRLPDAK